MKIKKLITFVATGALVVSCLAVVTGCSSYDPENDLKEAFISQPKFSEPESSEWTNSEPFEIVDFSYEATLTNPENKQLEVALITSTVKNNVCELEVQTTATRTGSDSDSPHFEIDLDNMETQIKEVFETGVNQVPEAYEQFSPDLDSVQIRYEDNEWIADVDFANPPSFFSEFTDHLTFNGANKYWGMTSVATSEDDYKLSDSLFGTYSVADSDITISIVKSEDGISVTFNNPSTIEKKIGFTPYTFSAGTITFDNVRIRYGDNYEGVISLNMGTSLGVQDDISTDTVTPTDSAYPSFEVRLKSDNTISIRLTEHSGSNTFNLIDVDNATYTKK